LSGTGADTDIIITDVPVDVAAALDARAARQGLSRGKYVRRLLIREAAGGSEVSPADLVRFGAACADLADRGPMGRAWE
jgi:hypothetical protein